MKFTELSLDQSVLRGVSEAGFLECTPVQEKAFGYTLAGRDVLVQSQTGTGKTAAFLISILQAYATSKPDGFALVVVPTRELAVQIEAEAHLLGGNTGARITSVYGGVAHAGQEKKLSRGIDLLIGTPGRLLDYAQSNKVSLNSVYTLVIDEADRMFDMGFYPDIWKMIRKMPPPTKRHTMLFSATLSTRVRNLAWKYMNEPGEVEISPQNLTVDQVTQELYHVSAREKLSLLLGILKKDEPENCLIFCNTKVMAMELAWRLTENGLSCSYLIGDLPQKKRLQIIDGLKKGRLLYLVATDVAARGLHVDELSMVVNYDVPEDYENYVHRIGRTARAGKSGKAVTLACEKFVYGLESIEEYIKAKIPVVWYDEGSLEQDLSRGKRFQFDQKEIEPAYRQGSKSGGRKRRTPPTDRRESSEQKRAHMRQGVDQGRGSVKQRAPGSWRSDSTPTKRPKRNLPAHAPVPPSQSGPGQAPLPRGTSPQKSRSSKPGQTKQGASVDERLSRYRSKYGENFVVLEEEGAGTGQQDKARTKKPQKGSTSRQPDKIAGSDRSKPESVIKRIIHLFKRKKN